MISVLDQTEHRHTNLVRLDFSIRSTWRRGKHLLCLCTHVMNTYFYFFVFFINVFGSRFNIYTNAGVGSIWSGSSVCVLQTQFEHMIL